MFASKKSGNFSLLKKYGNTSTQKIVGMDSKYCGHVNPEIKQSIQINLVARDFIRILFAFHGDSIFKRQENYIFFFLFLSALHKVLTE